MATNYTFTKKLSMKGNMEMRTNFGYQKAMVFTYVNGYFYVNLYNNSKSNPGRCSISYTELEELVAMKPILEDLKPQMIQEHNLLRPNTPAPQQQHPLEQQQHQQQQYPLEQQHQQKQYPLEQQQQQVMPPPQNNYVAQPITVLGQTNKRPNTLAVGPPAKKPKLDGEENWDPMTFFTQCQ